MVVPGWLGVRGRMGRQEYWRLKWTVALVLLACFAAAIVLLSIGVPRPLLALLLIPIAWVVAADQSASVRRLHDRGLSGWWVALSTILWLLWAMAIVVQGPPFDAGEPRMAVTLAAGVFPIGVSGWLTIQLRLNRTPRGDRYGPST